MKHLNLGITKFALDDINIFLTFLCMYFYYKSGICSFHGLFWIFFLNYDWLLLSFQIIFSGSKKYLFKFLSILI